MFWVSGETVTLGVISSYYALAWVYQARKEGRTVLTL